MNKQTQKPAVKAAPQKPAPKQAEPAKKPANVKK
jgi:hypothetical protein